MTRFILLCSLSFLLGAVPGSADTIRVPGDQPTIQAAIDAAVAGDIILVAPGTYTGAGNRDIDFLGKDVVLTSEGGAAATVVDCQGTPLEPHRAIILQSGETRAAVIEGFTLTNGRLVDPAANGGAILCSGASPTIRECWFINNSVAGQFAPPGAAGGAVAAGLGDPLIEDCVFRDNGATYGGAIAVYSGAAVIRRSTIFRGGGFYGAVWGVNADVQIEGCSIASTFGDALFIEGGSLSLANTIIAFNVGLAVSCSFGPHVTVACCDIFGNMLDYGPPCLEGFLGVAGNFRADPYFCSLQSGDLRLAADSPCLPGHHPQGAPCGLIGALDQGCGPVTVEPATWGSIKGIYR